MKKKNTEDNSPVNVIKSRVGAYLNCTTLLDIYLYIKWARRKCDYNNWCGHMKKFSQEVLSCLTLYQIYSKDCNAHVFEIHNDYNWCSVNDQRAAFRSHRAVVNYRITHFSSPSMQETQL